MSPSTPQYDVVIVGAGVSGNLIAKELGLAGKKVLILEGRIARSRQPRRVRGELLSRAGQDTRGALSGNRRTHRIEGPSRRRVAQPGNSAHAGAPRCWLSANHPTSAISCSSSRSSRSIRRIPIRKIRRRIGTATSAASSSRAPSSATVAARHGIGSARRCASWKTTSASRRSTTTAATGRLPTASCRICGRWRRKRIGVSASVAQQEPLEVVGLEYPPGYQYPMQAIPDEHGRPGRQQRRGGLQVPGMLDGQDDTLYDVFVTPTPAGRNSEPYDDRRVCAGKHELHPHLSHPGEVGSDCHPRQGARHQQGDDEL